MWLEWTRGCGGMLVRFIRWGGRHIRLGESLACGERRWGILLHWQLARLRLAAYLLACLLWNPNSALLIICMGLQATIVLTCLPRPQARA